MDCGMCRNINCAIAKPADEEGYNLILILLDYGKMVVQLAQLNWLL